MKKILSLLLALALLSLPILSGCRNALPAETAPVGQESDTARADAETKPTGKPLSERTEIKTGPLSAAFVEGHADFALDLYRKYYEENGKNALLSPLSVAVALTMAANGAKGETKAQLEKLLCAGMDVDTLNTQLYTFVTSLGGNEKAMLKAADSVWYAEKVLEPSDAFLSLMQNYYAAEVRKIDLSLAKPEQPVNDWVKEKTDGMIPSILPDRTIDEYTAMILVNALSFIAEWQNKGMRTWDKTFTGSDGKEKTLPFFSTDEYGYIKGEKETGFVKRYAGGTYAFLALLPEEGTNISDYIASLDGEKYLTLVNSVEDRKVITEMPEFTTDTAASLVDLLKVLGVTDAFDPDKADFTGLGATKNGLPLYISDVLHKTHIEVTKDGTKAAAATAVLVPAGSAMPVEEPPRVVLDRPFCYAIIDTATGLPIFFGCYEG
ncbi:MAG: serpin family protein [Clostridia bacterium]|nr:serpin family protein [Clostridia bacterium]